MTSVRARVHHGRLVVDVPTDLPEGLEVTLAVLDDDLTEEDRASLAQSLEDSYAQADRGELEDLAPVLAGLRTAPKR